MMYLWLVLEHSWSAKAAYLQAASDWGEPGQLHKDWC